MGNGIKLCYVLNILLFCSIVDNINKNGVIWKINLTKGVFSTHKMPSTKLKKYALCNIICMMTENGDLKKKHVPDMRSHALC